MVVNIMQGDPYWLNAKYAGNCSKCKEGFLKGAKVFWYPRTRDIFYRKCAEEASADFQRNAQFEQNVNDGYSGNGW
jgi:hypothetical protein